MSDITAENFMLKNNQNVTTKRIFGQVRSVLTFYILKKYSRKKEKKKKSVHTYL